MSLQQFESFLRIPSPWPDEIAEQFLHAHYLHEQSHGSTFSAKDDTKDYVSFREICERCVKQLKELA